MNRYAYFLFTGIPEQSSKQHNKTQKKLLPMQNKNDNYRYFCNCFSCYNPFFCPFVLFTLYAFIVFTTIRTTTIVIVCFTRWSTMFHILLKLYYVFIVSSYVGKTNKILHQMKYASLFVFFLSSFFSLLCFSLSLSFVSVCLPVSMSAVHETKKNAPDVRTTFTPDTSKM